MYQLLKVNTKNNMIFMRENSFVFSNLLLPVLLFDF